MTNLQTMQGLIRVDYTQERPAVSARDLYQFLGVGADFSHWFRRMCEYGFSEGQDFTSFLTESTGGRPAQDAALSIDMAKEICMLQRTERGKQARQYFIQLEKDWNSPEKVMARALKIANRKIAELEAGHKALEAQVEAFKPIKHYVDTILSSPGTMTTTQIAADYDLTAYRLNKILHEAGLIRKVNGQWVLYKDYMGNGYTKSETVQITRSDGRPDAILHTRWTQRGRLKIHDILTARGIQAIMDKEAA